MLVIEGKSRQEQIEEERQKWEEMSIQEHMDYYMDQGIQEKRSNENGRERPGESERETFTRRYCKKVMMDKKPELQ